MSSLDLILIRITKLEKCITDLTEQMQKMNASIKKVNILEIEIAKPQLLVPAKEFVAIVFA